MGKKSIILSSIVVIVLAISIYLLTRPKVLGNINQSYSKQTTTASEISFLGEAGDRIKFSFSSNIESGDLDITLVNCLV